jgi:hypothetical protein
MSGLGMAANVLDLPGSFARDVIGGIGTGNWNKYNPFDQFLSPTRSENRTYFREDILPDLGLMRPNRETGIGGWLEDPGEGLRDVAGFGLDVLSDPLSYLGGATLKALGKGGNVLRKAGAFPEKLSRVERMTTTVRQLAKKVGPDELENAARKSGFDSTDDFLRRQGDKPVGGLMSLHTNPFGSPVGVVGTGKVAQKVGAGLDWLGKSASYGKIPGTQISPGRQFARMFSRRAAGLHTPEVAPIAEKFVDKTEGIRRGSRQEAAEKFSQLDRAGAIDDEASMLGRMEAEGVLDHDKLSSELSEKAKVVAGVLKSYYSDKPMGVTKAAGDLLDHIKKSTGVPLSVDNNLKRILKENGFSDETIGSSTAKDLIDQLREKAYGGSFPGMFDKARSVGMRVDKYVDAAGVRYFPREFIEKIANMANTMHREDYLRGLKEGTEQFRKVIADPNMLKGSPDDAVEYFKSTYGAELESIFPTVQTAGFTTQQIPGQQVGKSQSGKSIAALKKEISESKSVIKSEQSSIFKAQSETKRLDIARIKAGPGDAGGRLGAKISDQRRKIEAAEDAIHRQKAEIKLAEGQVRSLSASTGKPIGGGSKVAEVFKSASERAKYTKGFEQAVRDRETQIQELVDNIRNNYTPEQRAAGGFGVHVLLDAQNAKIGMQIGIARRASAIEALGEFSMPYGKYDEASGVSRSVADILDKAGLDEITDEGGALWKLGEKVEKKLGINYRTDEGQHALRNMRVPERVAADIVRLVEGDDIKNVTGPLLSMFDQFTNLFKVGVLSWPARVSRDFTSSQMMNILTGNWSPGAAKGMHTIVAGGTHDFTHIPVVKQMLARQGLEETAENSTEMMRQLLYAQEIHVAATGAQGVSEVLGDVTGMLPSGAKEFAAEFAGRDPLSPFTPSTILNRGASLKTLEAYNPLATRGVLGRTKTTAKIPAIAEAATRYTDSMGRGVAFITNLERGAAPHVAGPLANALQVNYLPRTFTAAEKRYLKRAFPFYSFISRMIPEVTRQLINRPGGGIAQAIRAQAAGAEQDKPLPPYVGQTSAIPWSTSPDGTQTYLTGLGLMHEDPLSVIGDSLSSTLSEVMARTNPLMKLVPELATGKSFFQRGPLGGRDLADMDPTLGRLATNLGLREKTPAGRARPILGQTFEHVMANMPTSRLFNTLRTLSDERKAIEGTPIPGPKALLNVLTGLRITDVSPRAQRSALRDTAFALAREQGARPFTTFSFSKDVIAKTEETDPEAARKMRAFMRLKRLVSQKSRKEREQREKE